MGARLCTWEQPGRQPEPGGGSGGPPAEFAPPRHSLRFPRAWCPRVPLLALVGHPLFPDVLAFSPAAKCEDLTTYTSNILKLETPFKNEGKEGNCELTLSLRLRRAFHIHQFPAADLPSFRAQGSLQSLMPSQDPNATPTPVHAAQPAPDFLCGSPAPIHLHTSTPTSYPKKNLFSCIEKIELTGRELSFYCCGRRHLPPPKCPSLWLAPVFPL